MSLRLLAVGCLVAVWCATMAERPALADDAAKARELYRKGRASFAVGEYEAAAEAYQSAYKLKPDPALLYDAAQAYRLAGKNDRALTLYRNYLRFYPDASNAETVNGQIAKLERLEAERAAKTAPPIAPPPPPLAAASPPAAVAEPAVTATVTAPSPGPAERPLYRRPWFWGVVGGAAAVAVVAIVVVASSGGGGSWNNLPEVRELRSGATVRW